MSACNKTDTQTTDTTITGEQQIIQELPAYISENFYEPQHHLDLAWQNLTQMPDICADITTGDMLYDIRSINLANNEITEISVDYSCLTNLKELNLSYNQIEDIENLENLAFLSKLELHKNQIKKIRGLSDIKNLTDLNLWYNKITSVKGLEKIKSLKTLQLQHNQIDDIGLLTNLTNLETLKLEYNQISDPETSGQFAAIKEVAKNLEHLSTGGNE